MGINIAMFAFCGFINRHRVIGGVLITVLIFILLIAFLRLAIGRDLGSGFSSWFLTAGERQEVQTEYLLAILVSFPFFFAVVVYYFTQILYRMSFLTLVSLVPCVISVKAIAGIDTFIVAIIAILNVSILIYQLQYSGNTGVRTSSVKAVTFSGAVFVFLLLIISALIPKDSNTIYYSVFEMLFMDSTISLGSDFSGFADVSGNADMYRNFQNRLMYTVESEDPLYFKRQTFDFYDFDNNYWTYDESSSLEPAYELDEYEDYARKLNFTTLQAAYTAACDADPPFAEKYGLTSLTEFREISDTEKTAVITAQNFSARYIPVTSRAVSVYSSNSSLVRDESGAYAIVNSGLEHIGSAGVTNSGIFRMLNDGMTKSNMVYHMTYRSEIDILGYWTELGAANLTDEEASQMLEDVHAVLIDENADSTLIETVEAFIIQHDNALDYKEMWIDSDYDNIPAEITALAAEITADCTYDWEKANAIVLYFRDTDNGYIYNIDYIPPDDSIEYFLFESKTGSCSEFATAFSLLARSLGLNVRYCEGYSPDSSMTDGTYYIRDSGSHAYPEVYIQGMGWFVYEPTIASVYNSNISSDDTTFEFTVDYSLVTAICIIAAAMLIAALILIYLSPIIYEKIFLHRVNRSDNEKAVTLVYNRIVDISKRYNKNANALTPYELSLLNLERTGYDMGEFVFTAEDIFYGDRNADQNDKQFAVDTYNSLRERIKQLKRKR